MTTATIEQTEAQSISHAEWLAARKQFLAKEKEFTHLRDELSRQRRELPREKVEKKYVFEGPNGTVGLADLFGDRSQLVVYHFMFGPGWTEGCPSCSFIADQFDSIAPHMAQRDTRLVAVSRATSPDYHVSFSKEDIASGKAIYNYETSSFPSEEGPGASVFYRHDGEILHTYSTYGRGLDMMLNAYNFLDLTPKGRDEEGLPWPMAWVRHHDKYGDPKALDAIMLIAQSKEACCSEK